MPLISCVVKVIEFASWSMLTNAPCDEVVGSIACRPFAPMPAVILKLRKPPAQLKLLNDELFRGHRAT